MASIAAIQKQIAHLEKQAVSLRKAETASVVAKLKAMIARHGLTAEDLGLAGKPAKSTKPATTRVDKADKATTKISVKTRAKPGPRKTAGVPRYQDPKTGKTWTGNGKAPGWIAGAKQRDAFLIAAPATEPSAPAAPKKAPKAAPDAAPAAAKARRAVKPLRPDFGTVVRPVPTAAAPAPVAAKRARRSAKVAAPASVAAVATDSPSTPA